MDWKKSLKKMFVIALAVSVMGGTGVMVTAAASHEPEASISSGTVLVNQSRISGNTVSVGEYIKLYGVANGGSGTYQYGYYYRKTNDTTWHTIKKYSDKTVVTFKPDAAGEYELCIKVKDSANTIEKKLFTIKAYETFKSTSSVNKTAITLGQSFKVYGAASGGSGSYQYAYYYKSADSDKWITLKAYSDAAVKTLQPKKAGSYDVMVKVKDTDNRIVKDQFKVTVANELLNQSTIKLTEITQGQTIKATASAKGGSGKYEYSYLYKKSDETKWRVAKNYSSQSSYDIKPLVSGKCDVCVKIKDSNGAIAKKTFTVNVAPTLVNNSTIDAVSIKPGGSVTITAAAKGGKGTYSYAYAYKKSVQSEWTTVGGGYSNANSFTLKISEEGSYQLYVKVKDTNGMVVTKSFTVSAENSGRNAEIDKILDEIITPKMTDLEKVRAIHDWLVINVDYDYEGYQNDNMPDTDFTAEGLLATRVAVCDGYAKAFAQMATQAGLEAIRLTGNAFNGFSLQSHAWNQVKVDGKWYNIDVTWDDPLIDGKVITDGSNLSYRYFLRSDTDLKYSHGCDAESKAIRHECTDDQPLTQLADIMIKEDLDGKPNYIYADTSTDLKKEIQKLADKGYIDIGIIYYDADKHSDPSYILTNIVSPARPQGMGMNMEMSYWKFDYYYLVKIEFTW